MFVIVRNVVRHMNCSLRLGDNLLLSCFYLSLLVCCSFIPGMFWLCSDRREFSVGFCCASGLPQIVSALLHATTPRPGPLGPKRGVSKRKVPSITRVLSRPRPQLWPEK